MFGRRTIDRTPSRAVERLPYGWEAVTARAEENAQYHRDVVTRGTATANSANRLVLEARRTTRALQGKR